MTTHLVWPNGPHWRNVDPEPVAQDVGTAADGADIPSDPPPPAAPPEAQNPAAPPPPATVAAPPAPIPPPAPLPTAAPLLTPRQAAAAAARSAT